MHARALDDAAARLRALRHEEWERLGLAALALGLSGAATVVRPGLAVPLLVGGVAVWALGLRALWLRWELVDRLANERSAYAIAEVRAYAAREAAPARRRCLAASLRHRLREPDPALAPRLRAYVRELEALARDLDDVRLELDPACAVQCARLLREPAGSPLLDPALPAADLGSRVRRIRGGFRPRRA